jgi:hypothetical protein
MSTKQITRDEIAVHVLSPKAAVVLHRAIELGLTVETNDAYTEWSIKSSDWRRPALLVKLGETGPRSSSVSLRGWRSRAAKGRSHLRFLTEAGAVAQVERIAR